jgi:hypothetical protein
VTAPSDWHVHADGTAHRHDQPHGDGGNAQGDGDGHEHGHEHAEGHGHGHGQGHGHGHRERLHDAVAQGDGAAIEPRDAGASAAIDGGSAKTGPTVDDRR